MQHYVSARIAVRIALCVLFYSLEILGHAADTGTSHSSSHPLASPLNTPGAASRPVFYQPPPAPLGLVAAGDKWSVYSRGGNRINGAMTVGAETWLATDMGVKRIDRGRKTVTHFTRLDGLPEDRVLGVTAEADASWSLVAVKHGETPATAVCELRRGSARWRVLRETPRPIVPILPQNSGANMVYSPGAALENAVIAACPEKVCVALSPVRRDDRIFAYCYDRRLSVWDEIPSLPSAVADRTALSITWLDVDRDGIWLATTAGLLRYQLREKVWRRFLPDRMVYAATKANDGTLWLASFIAAAAPVDQNPRSGVDNAPAGQWIASHFFPKTGANTSYAVPDAGTRQSGYGIRAPMTIAGISVVGSSVWLSPGAPHPYGNPVPFYRLNTQDGMWRFFPVQSPGDVDSVPDAALAKPTLPRSTLQNAFYPWRLTEWVCRDSIDSRPQNALGSSQVSKEPDGSQWTTDGRTLVQTDARGVTLRRVGLNHVNIPITPQISAVTLLNGTLYATSNGELQAFDAGGKSWRKVRMPRGNWSNPNDDRLIPDGDHLWVGSPSNALRFDPKTQLFSTESTTQSGGYRLLGAIGATVWLRGPDSLLYRPDPQSGEPDAVETAPLPADIGRKYEKPQPFGLAVGALWFRVQDRKEPEKGMVIGYDPVAASWLPGRPARASVPTPPSCLAVGRRVYFPAVEEAASVTCFDADTGQWSIAAPKPPQGRGEYSLTLVSVDEEAIWSVDAGMRSLMCFHRKALNWELFDIPSGVWLPQNANESARSAGTIFLATSLGVWSFDIQTHKWTQLPGFPGRDIYLNGITADSGSIWSIARPGNGNQAFAVRFDKTARKWTAWGGSEGFPERAYPNVVVPDGGAAWTTASQVCFHLDPAANRWDNVSVRLARPDPDAESGPITILPDLSATPYLEIGDIVPDAEVVWLLPRAFVNKRDNAVNRPLLVRYDRRSCRYERLSPMPGSTQLGIGNLMQVDTNAVWVPTNEGVYRFDKSARSWRRVDPPSSAQLWGKTVTTRVLQQDRSYVFYGTDSAIEWKE